ncbi:TPA: hypothetical protein IUU01_001268 [Enterococcus faecalis]|nr:hypothetical protein [Enterococcus faecalis]HAP3783614.1 hypothetical protein [Enterococcus faecalis]HAP3854819.1 hypothetical protein [Enterococcus faecalis]HAP3859786.1 hypothetical protein [Enterococcus faecalis]
MVPKPKRSGYRLRIGFRVMLFRMVPKQINYPVAHVRSFRVMLFRMVPKHQKQL